MAAQPKEEWGAMMKRIFFNATAPLTDQEGGVVIGTGMGQEVIYSKIIRKVMKADNKSWINLVVFSLLTAAFDEGLGAWYGEHKTPAEQGFGDVAKEFPRPILSCLAINYIMSAADQARRERPCGGRKRGAGPKHGVCGHQDRCVDCSPEETVRGVASQAEGRHRFVVIPQFKLGL